VHIGLHIEYPLFLSDFNETNFLGRFFETYSNKKIHENPSSGNRVVPRGETDVTKPTDAFRNFQNEPNELSMKNSQI